MIPVIKAVEMMSINNAEKNELRINGSFSFFNLRSRPASSMIIVKPTAPKVSTISGGMGIKKSLAFEINLKIMPAKSSSSTEGTFINLLTMENKYDSTITLHNTINNNSVLIETIVFV